MAKSTKKYDTSLVTDRLRVIETKGDGVAITQTELTARACSRFEEFMSNTLSTFRSDLVTPIQSIVASVIAFECLTVHDLPHFFQALTANSATRSENTVAWTIGGKVRRSELCCLTLAALSHCAAPLDHANLLNEIETTLSCLYPLADLPPSERNVQGVFKDQQAWAYVHLPMPLVADYIGVLPVSRLGQTAIDRKMGYCTRNQDASELPTDTRNHIESEVVQAVIENDEVLAGGWVIEQLGKVTSGLRGTGINLSNLRVSRALKTRLGRVVNQLGRAGPVEAIIVGWVCDLATNGSARKSDPRIGTLADYLNAALRPIYQAIKSQDSHPLDMSDEQWKQAFKCMLGEGEVSKNLATAVGSFHKYVVRVFDVQPQGWIYEIAPTISKPKANILWPHEIEAAPSAVEVLGDDERQISQVKTWVKLLSNAPMRFAEIKWIRLRDLAPTEQGYDLKIAARRFAGAGKTKAASRVIPIHDPKCVASLSQWLARRELEGAGLDDLLFGDPQNTTRIYRLGACYALLNSALKSVTGDQTAASHIFRHTVLSNRVQKALLDIKEVKEVNELDVIAVEAGHKSFETTWTTYFHLPEAAQRHWIDRSISRLQVTDEILSRWTGVKPAALGQRRHRYGVNWNFLIEVRRLIPSASQQAIRSSPASTECDKATIRPVVLTITKALSVLHDVMLGYKTESICSRNSIGEMVVGKAVDFVSEHDWLNIQRSSASNKDPFRRLDGFQWKTVIARIDRLPSDFMVDVVRTWSMDKTGSYLLAGEAGLSKPVVKFLWECSVGIDRLLLRVNGESNDESPAAHCINQTCSAISSVYRAKPRIESTAHRRGRASCYLQVLTRPHFSERVVPPALNDTKSLNALVTGIAFQLKVNKESA